MASPVNNSGRVLIGDTFEPDAFVGALTKIFDDKNGILGSNLDVGSFSIISTANGNILINPNGTGVVQIGKDLDTNGNNIRFDSTKGLLDDSENELVLFTSIASAITYINITNNSTGSQGPLLQAVGEANVDLRLAAIGTGDVKVTVGGLRVTSDNEELSVGVSDDLKIAHDGSDSTIYNSTGHLKLKAAALKAIQILDGADPTKFVNLLLAELSTGQSQDVSFPNSEGILLNHAGNQMVAQKILDDVQLNQPQLRLPFISAVLPEFGYTFVPSDIRQHTFIQLPGTTQPHIRLLDSSAIGVSIQAYDADTLKADTADVLTAGFAVTIHDAGTKSSGTYTPDEANGNMQKFINGGAHTLAPPANDCTLVLQQTNNGSAGTITTSGFTLVDGDSFTTTNGHDFFLYITNSDTFSLLTVKALQ